MKQSMIIPMSLIGLCTLAQAAPTGPLMTVDLPSSTTMKITPTAQNHTYSSMGIKSNTPELSFTEINNTNTLTHGFYRFSASHDAPKTFSFTPVSEPLDAPITVCLDVCGTKALSCQNITTSITYPAIEPYFASGSFRNNSRSLTGPLAYSSNDNNTWSLGTFTPTLSFMGMMGGVESPMAPDKNRRPIQAPSRFLSGIQSNLQSLTASSGIAGSLEGISCDSATGLTCTAVGTSIVSGSILPLVEKTTNGGATWAPTTAQPALPTGIVSIAEFKSISCNGTTCTAAGTYYNTSLNETLPISYLSTDSGASWTSSTAFTLPPSGTNYKLEAITCTGANCVATGSYINVATPLYSSPLSYQTSNNGTSWTTTTPVLNLTVGTQGILTGVACDGTTGQTCSAVGRYLKAFSSSNAPLAYKSVNGGSTWTTSTLPTLSSTMANLYSVSCDSTANTCMAAGNYTTSAGILTPLTYITNDSGASWTQTSTLPLLPTSLSNNAVIDSIFCNTADASQCALVGWYGKTVSSALSYYTTDSGATWIDNSPPVSGHSASYLLGVSCEATATTCTTVGAYTNGTTSSPLIYSSTDSGITLTNQALNSGNLIGSLNAVACSVGGGSCTSVGSYFPNGPAANPLGYASPDAGVTWSAIDFSSILPEFALEGNLYDVACSTNQCSAVGQYSISSTNALPLSIASSDGGVTWITSPGLPTPPSGGTNGILSGVACGQVDNTLCSSVGAYNDGTNIIPMSFTSSDGGSHWTMSNTMPTVATGASAALHAVTCSDTGLNCTAVGIDNFSPTTIIPITFKIGLWTKIPK